MELITKRGYKQTEIGLIPEDWTVKRFDDFGRFFKGKGIKKDEVRFEGIPCVRYGELYTRYDNVIKETFSFITIEVAEQSIKLKKGDLLFAGSGETKEDIGKSAVILRDDTYAGGDIVVFRAKDIDPIFLGFMSNSIPVSKQKAINGQGDAVVHIYSGGIANIQIPLPPTLIEQKAIATALSDADELISNLDKLITKKKAIKQGAMQQLLTPPHKGGKRLPGFSGEWVDIELQNLCDVSGGGTPSTSVSEYWNGHVEWFTPTEIGKKKFVSSSNRKISTLGLNSSSANILPAGAVLLTSRASIGDVAILQNPACTNQGFQSLIPKNLQDSEFIYQLILTKKNDLINLSSGSTFLEVSPKKVKSLIIKVPKNVDERAAIAQTLYDMDAEIEQLETKKVKYQSIKQGMMQELLTGKTRLV